MVNPTDNATEAGTEVYYMQSTKQQHTDKAKYQIQMAFPLAGIHEITYVLVASFVNVKPQTPDRNAKEGNTIQLVIAVDNLKNTYTIFSFGKFLFLLIVFTTLSLTVHGCDLL